MSWMNKAMVAVLVVMTGMSAGARTLMGLANAAEKPLNTGFHGSCGGGGTCEC